MKKTFSIIALCCIAVFSHAQITSTQDGNWLDPQTWGGIIVPTPGTEVIINHNVTLNLDYAYNSGGITINSSGSLTQDATPRALALSGGYLIIHGSMEINTIALYTGKITNNNNLTVNQYLFLTDSLINNGSIQGVDSTYANAYLEFKTASSFTSDAFWNDSILVNHGTIQTINFLNSGDFLNHHKVIATNHANTLTEDNYGEIYTTDISNAGIFNNDGQIFASNSFSNFEIFNNSSGAWLEMDNNFLNADSIGLNASFLNNGVVITGNNWSNTDTIYGTTGEFYVQNLSSNFGYMEGTFDFCDATPPASAPYIDLNTGYFDANITFDCVHQGIETEESNILSIYPNPASDYIVVSGMDKNGEIIILNIAGQKIMHQAFSGEKKDIRLNIKALASGIYLLQYKTASQTQTVKFVK